MLLNHIRDDIQYQLYLRFEIIFISGMSGKVEFDDNGDRDPFYWVWDYTSPTGIPRIIAVGSASPLYGQVRKKYKQSRFLKNNLIWFNLIF